MFNRARFILASCAALLGVGHIVVGILSYKVFSTELLWFLGAGIAMIIAALANFKQDQIWVLRLQNALILSFAIALVMLVPQPQVWLGLILFASLFILSCFKPAQ